MPKKNAPQPDGLISRSDASGNTAWSSGSNVYAQSRLITDLLSRFFAATTEASVELSLVLLDGVRPSCLEDIVAQESSLYILGGTHYLEWTCTKTGVIQRRTVSPHTARYWPKTQAWTVGPCISPYLPMANGHKERLEGALRELGSTTTLVSLEESLLAWWSTKLHPVLFAHVADLQSLTAVPRSTLAREAMRRPLPTVVAPGDPCDDLGIAGDFLDAAMASEATDVHSGVIQLAVDIFRIRINEIDGLTKRHWLAELSKLHNQSMHAGPWACLVLGWGCYMVEGGTVMESNPAVSTLQSYFSKSAYQIHRMLQSMPQDFANIAWSGQSLSAFLQAIIDQQSVGNQAVMRAALRSFHAFMVESFDIEPLQQSLEVDKPSRPIANVVWPHELALACSWARRHCELYIGAPAQIVLAIAGEAPCRAGELTRLRLSNISFVNEGPEPYMEIEIARDASSGRLKTPSSQRRVVVKSAQTIRLLRAWIRLRHRQGARLRDFLFGAPADMQTVYKPNAVLAWCAALLRAATGDPSIRVHTLRHGVISLNASEVLSSSPWLDINRLEVLAAEAGHASPVTTLYTYSHIYEGALRLWLDVAQQSSVSLKSSWAPHLLNISATAIRQSASRAEISASDWMWHKLRTVTHPTRPDSLLYLVSHAPPEPPSAATRGSRYLSIGVTRNILKEVLHNTPLQTIGWRYALDIEHLKACVESLQRYALSLARRMHPRKLFIESAVGNLADALQQADIKFHTSDQSKFETLWETLERAPDIELLKAAVHSWSACRKGHLLGLSAPSDCVGFLRLLKEGHVDLSAFRVCVQGDALPVNDSVTQTNLLPLRAALSNEINAIFSAIFHRSAKVWPVITHPDRPAAYLRWNSADTTGASGGSTRGLDALMVCVYFYLLLAEQL